MAWRARVAVCVFQGELRALELYDVDGVELGRDVVFQLEVKSVVFPNKTGVFDDFVP